MIRAIQHTIISFIISSLLLGLLLSWVSYTQLSKDLEHKLLIARQEGQSESSLAGIKIQAESKGAGLPFFYFGFEKIEQQPLDILCFSWNGKDCYSHVFFSQIINLSEGYSEFSGQSYLKVFYKAFSFSLVFGLFCLIICAILALLVLVKSLKGSSQFLLQFLNNVGFYVQIIPIFILATLSVAFLSGDRYGVFPSVGWIPEQGFSLSFMHYLILPFFCLGIPLFFWLFNHFHEIIKAESNLQYTLGLKAKGNDVNNLLRKHILPNSKPMLLQTMIQVFPVSLAGVFGIEWVFNLNGIGTLFIKGIQNNEWILVWLIVKCLIIALLVMRILVKISTQNNHSYAK